MSQSDGRGAGAGETPPAGGSEAVISVRAVDIVVSVLLLALAALLAYDNWRTGMGWDSTGPQAGYFPFYLSVILAAACVYGVAKEFLGRRTSSDAFVTRDQFRRVLQVL